MSDNLVKRLRSGLFVFDDWDAAADRIEELEGKLAKAEQLINELRYAWSVRDLTQTDFDKARAELKGQDDASQ